MMENQSLPFEQYTTANLNPDILEKITTLEKELQSDSNQDIILIAYEEK
ncbi:hypothetical protein [Bacillus piscicola]|nr:hypothetical protein [Bacillus piscicola]